MPQPAGYSGRPLSAKLGIKEGTRVGLLSAPNGYERQLDPLPYGVTFAKRMPRETDFVQWFVKRRAALEARIKRVADALSDTGMLWVSWPKKSSGVASDLTEDALRAAVLPLGLVDVKVIAVDEIWSGLKFMRRVRLRGK
jgi:hypothetical protein